MNMTIYICIYIVIFIYKCCSLCHTFLCHSPRPYNRWFPVSDGSAPDSSIGSLLRKKAQNLKRYEAPLLRQCTE